MGLWGYGVMRVIRLWNYYMLLCGGVMDMWDYWVDR